MAGSDAGHQRQLEKNALKFKLQNYTEVPPRRGVSMIQIRDQG